jgi:HAD superfamily hydrolase (TIGR01549 family)
MRVEAVLLDMGGVLLDMRGSNGAPKGPLDFRGRQAMLRLLGGGRPRHPGRPSLDDLERLVFEPWLAEYRQRYRRGREAAIEPHLEELARQNGQRVSAEALLDSWFEPYAEALVPTDGARAALQRLRRLDLKLALVSNVPLPGRLYRRVLDRHRMAQHFDTFRFSHDTGHRKPSPAMLRSALAELGVTASAAVMVGDRKASDVAAGRAAGTGTVWIESEHSDGPEPEWTIPSIGHLPQLVERLRS